MCNSRGVLLSKKSREITRLLRFFWSASLFMHPLELLLLYVCPLLDMQLASPQCEEGNKKPPSFPLLFLFSPEFLYMTRERKSAQTVSFCRNARGTLLKRRVTRLAGHLVHMMLLLVLNSANYFYPSHF